jgi:hypothetical protein
MIVILKAVVMRRKRQSHLVLLKQNISSYRSSNLLHIPAKPVGGRKDKPAEKSGNPLEKFTAAGRKPRAAEVHPRFSVER